MKSVIKAKNDAKNRSWNKVLECSTVLSAEPVSKKWPSGGDFSISH